MSSTASKRIASLASQVDSYLKLSGKASKPLQLVYTSSPTWPYPTSTAAAARPIDIGVLDSSFNPPQRAHYALASTPKPAFGGDDEQQRHFDAVLLLFSVRNADKGTGKSTDASPAQRLYMMELLAHDLARERNTAVAVAMVEEPLMISKSTLIHEYINENEHSSSQPQARRVRLHWLVGFDTLERFFQVRYYPSPDYFAQACQKFFSDERTTFVCARRGAESLPNANKDGADPAEEERNLLQSDHVKPWLDSGSIVMIDLHEGVRGVSSTAVRKLVGKGSAEEAALRDMTPPSVAKYLLEERVYGKE